MVGLAKPRPTRQDVGRDADAADVAVRVVAGTPVVTPVANPDTYSVAPDRVTSPAVLAVPATASVLANDTFTGTGTDRRNAVLVGGAYTAGTTPTYTGATANGSVTLNAADGSLAAHTITATYTPAAGFLGGSPVGGGCGAPSACCDGANEVVVARHTASSWGAAVRAGSVSDGPRHPSLTLPDRTVTDPRDSASVPVWGVAQASSLCHRF